MGLAVQRDLDELRAGLERWLGRPVGEVARPDPGYSCETLIVERDLVVRLPPVAEAIFPTYDLAQQTAVQDAVGAAGVPVAGPARYEPDPDYLGTPFVAMPFIAGPIPIEFTPIDPWLMALPDDADRRTVWTSFLETLVAIHRTPLDGLGLRTGLRAELAYWSEYLDWSSDGSPPPTLREAIDWCVDACPPSEPAAGALWGDVRLGNVIYDDASRTPKAVLDWDMVSAGPAETDLAWFLALEGVQTDLTKMTVPGFGTRDEAVTLVEAGLGRPLQDLPWHEVFALVRASAVSTRIAVLFERAGQRSMFKIGQDPTLLEATKRIESWAPR